MHHRTATLRESCIIRVTRIRFWLTNSQQFERDSLYTENNNFKASSQFVQNPAQNHTLHLWTSQVDLQLTLQFAAFAGH